MSFINEEKVTVNEAGTANNHKTAFKNFKPAYFNFHLGVLIFTPFLNKLAESGLGFIRQWLVSVLLGSQNIEQNKKLNYTSLSQLIGPAHKTLRTQRTLLKQAATLQNTEHVLRFNAELVGVREQSDFYYDPHTKHYTGQFKTLSTWCPSVRLADKGINMDYIHTTSGEPAFFDISDNFLDLRERFKSNIEKFRSVCRFDEDQVLTFIIDRGIYSMDVFHDIALDPRTHIITWEKGYENDKWDDAISYGNGFIVRDKNKKGDQKLVHYRYQDKIWGKNKDMRQVIVRMYDNNWKLKIEVSILSDDKDRDVNQIITLMLKRWVQENDFKYMINYFGLNQLTTYSYTDYRALRDKVEDKIYICSHHKTLTKEMQKVRAKFKTALFNKHRFDQKHGGKEKLTKKQQESKNRIDARIQQLSRALATLEEERSQTPKFVSKLDELIDQGVVRLDTDTKSFMDAIKLLARNMFYLAFQPFKEGYDNYRDDHVLFRHLTLSGGLIRANDSGYDIMLQPQMEYQPKVKKVIISVLEKINQSNPILPDEARSKITLKLKP